MKTLTKLEMCERKEKESRPSRKSGYGCKGAKQSKRESGKNKGGRLADRRRINPSLSTFKI
jgi:hypothetical protein